MTAEANIGREIKRLRDEAGLSQTQIAEFLGVDQSYISKCEMGERQFNIDSLERLCNLFGCLLSDLLNTDLSPETMNFAFRSSVIENDDLVAISEINRIALNIREMRKLMEDDSVERKD